MILGLACAGVLTGLATSFMPDRVSNVTLFEIPIFPGIAFGLVLAFACFRWSGAGNIAWLVLPVVTAIAWIGAVNLFYLISSDGKEYLSLGGFCAGAAGAAGVALGGMALSAAMRHMTAMMLVVAVGAIAGLLLEPALAISENMILLFTVWQASVAAAIGYALYCYGAALAE